MNKYIQYGLAVAIVLSLIVSAKGLIGGNQSFLAGGTTNFDSLSLSGTLGIGGVTTLPGNVDATATSSTFTSATTTPCSLQSPFAATSTLSQYLLAQTSEGNSPNTYEVAVAPTRYASSTAFAGVTITGQGVIIATSTVLVPPSYWVVIKNASSSIGANTPTGTCEGLFIQP